MFQLHILGTSSASPTEHRRPTAQVVSLNDRHYLVDCGEGTQMQLLRYHIRTGRLDAIFISHLHGDHVFGLPGLLTSLGLNGRTQALDLIAPAALQPMLKSVFDASHSYLPYELNFIPTDDFAAGSTVFETSTMRVELLPLEHRIFCRGFRFVEQNKRPKLDFLKAKQWDIPKEYFHLLKLGNSITLANGRVVEPDDILLPPDEPLSYAFCSDTRYVEALVPYIADSTLLYHESTFTHDLLARAEETHHSTALQAATIASMAKVKGLLLGHYSARYTDLSPILAEAQSVFPAAELTWEGRVVDIRTYAGQEASSLSAV